MSDDDLDAELAKAMRGRRLPPVTAALVLVLLLAAAFTAGVLVQKHHDKGLASSGGAATFSRLLAGRAGAGGTGAEGFGAFGGAAPSAGPTASVTGIPAVIGSVVRVQGRTLTVRNLGGRTITVHTSATTAVSGAASLAALTAGQNVAVDGSTAADGSVTATAVRVTS